MTRLITVFETVAEHHEQLGTLDSEKFARQCHFIGEFLGSPGGRLWVESGRLTLSAAIRRLLRVP